LASNDRILLDSVLSTGRSDSETKLGEAEYFELFCAEQILKDYDLSYDELFSGIVDQGDDGGIDGFYSLVEGELITDDDFDVYHYRKGARLDLYLIQSKQAATFTETAIDKLIATSSQIFDLSRDLKELAKFFNAALFNKVVRFREAYVGLSARHVDIHITCVYASKGDSAEIHEKVHNKADLLKQTLNTIFVRANVAFEFLGARELLELAQKQRSYTLQLKLVENPISTGEGAYVALAKISDYRSFITDERGLLRKYIFESNVRDFQGDVDVNADIRGSLKEANPKLDFWWLNNGVTIISSKASIAAKTITLDDVQVVNGLQTTRSIYNYFKDEQPANEQRSILVKIIVANDPEARDRIIKATNYQTPIPPSSLKATDRIQRDIETYLLHHGWFYDRRKNFYKNQGKPLHKIIGIPYLAQAVMAVLLREPDNSRARPSTLIKRETDYNRVFNTKTDLKIYADCIQLMKRVEDFVKYLYQSREHAPETAQNLRFHIAMAYAAKLTGKWDYGPRDLVDLSQRLKEDETLELLDDAVTEVLDLFDIFQNKNQFSDDRVAKSGDFVLEIVESATPGMSVQGAERVAAAKAFREKLEKDIPF